MSDVTLLRKLSRKSILKFGQYSELTVQEIINLNKHKYLRWVYFNSSKIDFMEDILDEIRIPQNFRIDKPSKNSELYNKVNQFIFDNLPVDFVPIYLEKNQIIASKRVKGKSVCKRIKDNIKFSKGSLQRKNHGK